MKICLFLKNLFQIKTQNIKTGKLISKEEIKSIVWISHIAYKDIDSKSRENMARTFLKRGLPVCVFEGHTHIEKFYTEVVDGKSLNIYTLAPVTFEFTIPNDQRASSYFYYQVVFSDGKMKSIESIRKRL